MKLTLHCLSSRRISFALLKQLTLSIVCLSMFGCAAQMAYRDGNKLIEQGQHEQGLKKLKEAADAAPTDPIYRSSYLRNRENVINDYLANADRLIRVSKNEEARKQYLAIVKIEPNNIRAIDGLALLDREANYQKIITDAKQAVAQNNRQSAINQLRGILAEQPTHAAATALMNEITRSASLVNPDISLAAVYKQPITIEFRDATLKQVFEVIARTSGLIFYLIKM